MKSKKSQMLLNKFVAFFVAFIAIILIFAFASTVLKLGGDKRSINLEVDVISESIVCDYDLLNFLRMKDSSGQTFAELLAYNKNFAEKAEEFFNENYARGDITRENWKFEIMTTDYKPITTFGELTDVDIGDTCKQIIPRNDGSLVIVRLGVDY